MPNSDAATALKRFGLGARPGEMARVAADPRGYLLASLAKADAALIGDAGLEPSHVTFTAALEAQRQLRIARESVKESAPATAPPQPKPGEMVAAPSHMEGEPRPSALPPPAAAPPQAKPGEIRRDAFIEEAAARFRRAARTEAAFVERLVMFWSNHFCVSAAKGVVRGVAGAYEREAIRPHVLGRFEDMLVATEMHPAMLVYLDNQLSIGPGSKAGLNRGRGLNENLAREILELHTLGVDGGYTQEDVTNLARILTGWTVGNLANPLAEPGKFFFAPARHEPGDWTVLGKRYIDKGQRTGEEVLADLARHPATARHIAVKLVRHFVSEEAPAGLVARLEKTFRDTGGDLAAVSRALIEAPEAWQGPQAKVLPPYDFLVAIMRGFAFEPRPVELLRLSAMLGQPLWRPPAPKGWPDADAAWAAPAALRERLRIAETAAGQIDRSADPRTLAADLLGEAMSAATRQAVARAETREQGLELLIMAPEFQRR
jgi:uncharacterized protein (DUF1800 family)